MISKYWLAALLLGLSNICWGTTYYEICHTCDPGNPTDPQVIQLQIEYSNILRPGLDYLNIRDDVYEKSSLPDHTGFYYAEWFFQFGKWQTHASGYTPLAGAGGGEGGPGGTTSGGTTIVIWQGSSCIRTVTTWPDGTKSTEYECGYRG